MYLRKSNNPGEKPWRFAFALWLGIAIGNCAVVIAQEAKEKQAAGGQPETKEVSDQTKNPKSAAGQMDENEMLRRASTKNKSIEPLPDPGNLNEAEKKEFEEMVKAAEEFNQQGSEYKKEIQQIIERKYQEQRDTVLESYSRVITELEKEEDRYRLEAIEVFERFLQKYPSDPSYTPRTLWRLAELYYEKSKIDFTAEQEDFDKKQEAFNRGELKEEPVPPTPHFERTVDLLQRLTQNFPSYPNVDGAYYLLAYCLQEQGENEEAQAGYLSFVERFPKSKLMPEVWTRLGESYFENPDKLDKAAEAYRRVLDYPESRMFDKALYKLAWTYYKVDRFQEAVERFDQLIAWADAGTTDEDQSEVSRTALRKEAMQYLAICFSEEEWTGSGVENAKAFFKKMGGRKYEGEFFRKLGEVSFLSDKYESAIAAYRTTIQEYPKDPENPKLMAVIVDAYYRLQKPDEAAQVQEEMIRLFGPSSEWRKSNQGNAEALLEADKLTENALYTSAVRHHTLAQKYKEQQKAEEARQEYEMAANVYSDYLTRFPGSRDSYKLTFYLAECYYYSLNFEKAAEIYAQVRDSTEGSEHMAEAANSVVLSYNNLVKAAEDSKQLEPLKIYTSKDRPADLEISPKPIPQLRQKLFDALEGYANRLPNDEQAYNMMFNSAKILYAYDHFDEARERFSRIVAETKDNALASSSINLIIESYLVIKDWEQVETWSRKLASLSRDPQQKAALKEFELGARFNRANDLMQAGKTAIDQNLQDEAQAKLDAAASEFVRLVEEDPKGKSSDKALNNAALCYTWSNRPISAGKIYERIVEQYPSSEFADQALFLMAGSAENSYQYQRAIDNFLKLVEKYPDSKFRADALYNAAVDLEGDQQYVKAAKAYERYAIFFKDRPDAAENFYRAGLMWEKQKAWKEMISCFTRFMRFYRTAKEQRERVVQAQMKIADGYSELGEKKRVLEGYQETLKLYKQYKLSAGGRAAEAAANAMFLLADISLKKYEAVTFNVPVQKLKKTLILKANTLKDMEEKYLQVIEFKRVQWTLAAYYRLGYLYENFADVLVNAPCPKGLNEEECDIYKGKLMDHAEAPIKKAVTAFQLAMDKSKEFKVVNQWIDKAYLSLNRFEPLQYPLQNEPETALVIDRHSPQPLLKVVESGIKPSGK